MAAMTLLQRVMLIVLAVAILAVLILSFVLFRERRRMHAAALGADTLEAHFDTNRSHVLTARDSGQLLGDSLVIVQRRVVQKAQEADALDKALQLERRAKIDLQARVHELEVRDVRASGPVRVDSGGVRRARFDLRLVPWTAMIAVALPPPPDTGRIDSLRVAIDPVVITARVQCGARNTFGIRPAQVTLTGPSWATLSLAGPPQQDPALCGNEKPTPGFFRRLISKCGIGPSYAAIVTTSPLRIAHGPGAAATCIVFP